MTIQPEQLRRALKIAARVVVLYGDAYVPLFERLRQEVMKLDEEKKTESLAIQLAKQYADLEE
jgi:hypothetical protein